MFSITLLPYLWFSTCIINTSGVWCLFINVHAFLETNSDGPTFQQLSLFCSFNFSFAQLVHIPSRHLLHTECLLLMDNSKHVSEKSNGVWCQEIWKRGQNGWKVDSFATLVNITAWEKASTIIVDWCLTISVLDRLIFILCLFSQIQISSPYLQQQGAFCMDTGLTTLWPRFLPNFCIWFKLGEIK